jgi:hypothetical protein
MTSVSFGPFFITVAGGLLRNRRGIAAKKRSKLNSLAARSLPHS